MMFHKRKLIHSVVLLLLLQLAQGSSTGVGGGAGSSSLNCTNDKRICKQACNEMARVLPYSATYCDTRSGNCICDCRDKLSSKCTFTPFTPCYSFCVNLNPNPETYLYVGGSCPVILNYANRTLSVGEQCACQCSLRESLELNQVY